MKYYEELLKTIKKEKPSKEKLSRIKIKLCKKHGLKKIPTDIEVLLNIPKKDIVSVKRFLITKPTRSISGVSVVAIMSKPSKCPHGKCAMCPGGVDSVFGNVPQSYTGKEPATRRAIRNDYDPYLQVMNRLEQYVVQGHLPDKVELIIMGGTFPALDKKYRDEFVAYALKAMNDFSRMFLKKEEGDIDSFKKFFELPADINNPIRDEAIKAKLTGIKGKASLEKEQRKNEKSSIRCIGMTMETRPDYAKLNEANEMLRLGCTRVELGVQSVYDSALKKIERGHSVNDSIEATQILKDLGLKINYHMMPGLPGIPYEKDLKGLKKLFDDDNFRPDMLKIYPCMVLKGTKLYKMWKKKEYTPLTTKKAVRMITEFKKSIPEYVRIMRVQRDIPTMMTEAGVDKTNLRQYIDKELLRKGIKCRCIRCREIGRNKENVLGYVINTTYYRASGGAEFFIAAEKNDSLLGFCRLRLPGARLRKEITERSCLVRELHVYGNAVQIGKKGKVQHRGIGKELLKVAEKIAEENGFMKVLVISGIGAREYYRKIGYKRDGVYMAKDLKNNNINCV